MNKKVLILMVLAGIIFTGSVFGTFILMRKPEIQVVTIIQDGTEIYRFDLSDTENHEIRIESINGNSYNTVTIKNGEVYISDAGCPDKTCMKTGILRSESIPIVCLPNKLIIRFIDEGEQQ